MKRMRFDCDNIHRRDFLRVAPLPLIGLGLSELLATEAVAGQRLDNRERARNVIMIWLAGGPSTIDMWDLKPDAPAEIRRGSTRLLLGSGRRWCLQAAGSSNP